MVLTFALALAVAFVAALPARTQTDTGKSAPQAHKAAGPADPALIDLAGYRQLLAKFKGKALVVNFWATWCIPCVSELPTFNKVHRDYASQGVSVIGVAMDEEGAAIVRPFLRKHPIDYTVALGSDPVARRYNLESYPVTVVFDRGGKEVKRFGERLTEADLLAAIGPLL